MQKLGVFTLYSEKGASSQYRAYIFKEKLEQNFDVEWFNFWNDKYVTKYMHNKKKYLFQIVLLYIFAFIKRWYQLCIVAPKYDVVFIQKGTIPKCKRVFLHNIKKAGCRIVFDVDDAIYTIKKDNSHLIAQVADAVICGNETLKAHYDQYNTDCIVLPTVENTNHYIDFWRNTFDEKIVGWIGSKTTLDNFDIVINALNKITEKHPEVKICIISNTALDYTERIKNAYLIPWDKDTYIEELSKFTIGIMPLKDNEMNRGKCGFKLIQYLNMKKPVIGSNVGVNADIIRGNGMIVSNDDEWEVALEQLLFDEHIYNECVENIENVFFEKYHFETVSDILLKTLRKCQK